MIFSLFRKSPSTLEQMQDFTTKLAEAPAEELGLAVAMVEHLANSWWVVGDLYDPYDVMARKPDFLNTVAQEINRLQATNQTNLAAGWMVWAHTFRAVNDVRLVPLAKSMWALLVRGAPFAHEAKGLLVPLIGFELRVEQPKRIPRGFE